MWCKECYRNLLTQCRWGETFCLKQGCASFVRGPYNQLQTSSWATRKINFFHVRNESTVLAMTTLNGLTGRLLRTPGLNKYISVFVWPHKLPAGDTTHFKIEWPLQVLRIVCKRKSPLLLLPRWRSRSFLHQNVNTLCGSEAPSWLPFQHSNRCGFPNKNTTKVVHPSFTENASKCNIIKRYNNYGGLL